MVKPFLKWAGGKGQLLGIINENLPASFETYIEPFVGSGAVVFDLLSNKTDLKKAIINDINSDLVNTYTSIRDNCERLVQELYDLQENYLAENEDGRKTMFYDIRDKYNLREAEDVTLACYFIFLNRTCFNGLYRVNASNQFNVPHGKYKNPKICDKKNLFAVSEALQRVEIHNDDYETLRDGVSKGCFVYLDPPYKPISETSAFNSYSAVKFDDDEQVRLKEFCDAVNDQGGYFMLSNSDPAAIDPNNRFFDDLYAAYRIQRIGAKRAINANGNSRGEVSELLITNYENESLLF